jgi:hypothetical protein
MTAGDHRTTKPQDDQAIVVDVVLSAHADT